ncbi:MAG TPA: class I SAM-dependent methyltransferase [Candidatus Dormibacteraeota bacterium]|nr:class I SAM-dependent methyltransferase [Candidatus Dormibacteraeota bacterium]
MAERHPWNSAYEGSPPWDIGRPQPEFVRLAQAGKLMGQTLDVGCGTGEHVMLAAQHGADAIGVDIAELAIERARAKAKARGIRATFEVADALHLDQLGLLFDVVTDSGLFHVFDDEQRPMFVQSLRSALRPGGMYYMMCFSDRQPGDWGPRRVSNSELRRAFAVGWSIDLMAPAVFDVTIDSNGAQAWLAEIRREPE